MPQVICQRTFYTASHSILFSRTSLRFMMFDTLSHFMPETFYFIWQLIQCKSLLINEVQCQRLHANYKHFYRARFYIDNSNILLSNL